VITKARVFTALIALAGSAAFVLLGIPLPFLLGPLFFCLGAALLRVPMQDMGALGTLMRTLLGVAVGATVTPELTDLLPEMAYSVAVVPLFVLTIGLVGVPFFRKVCKFDAATSYYAAMPGGFQDMVIFGQEAGADVRALALIHATRVLVIVTIVPILLSSIYGLSLSNPPGQPIGDIPPIELVLMALAAVIGWRGGVAIGLFGASILGPLIVTALLSLTGFISHRPPAEAIIAAQFFIGLAIGAKYVGVTLHELRKDILAGVVFCVILAAIAIAFAEAVTLLGFAEPASAFLAFSPGGQAEMAVIAIIAGADVAFVVTHHIVRILVVIVGAPLFGAMAGVRKGKRT
jgi:membrane AbrB-like protein